MNKLAGGAGAALAVVLAGPAQAGVLSLSDGIDAEYKLTINYSASMRLKDPSDKLINGPVNATTSLPTTVNFDDGDRNFKAGSLINNRISGLAELIVRGPNYGIAVSGDGFYDQVYHHPNHNDSPGTINKSEPPPQRFADGTRYYDGQRLRLLDAYAYGNFRLGPHQDVDLRVGRQVVAWGEALFFSGIATAQAPADASKAFIPGIEVKDILLPSNQVSLRMGVTEDLTLLGYYKLEYKHTELSPVGDYFSTTDVVGPGAEFIYLTVNPFYSLAPLPAPLNIPLGQLVPGTPQIWTATRGPDLKPSDYGQYGVGLNYQLTPQTSFGGYYLRYTDTAPMTVLNEGYQVLLNPLGGLAQPLQGILQQVEAGILAPTGQQPPPVNLALTSQAIGVQVPVSYNIAYQQGIHMGAMSFSTQAFGVSFAGEASYRDGIDLLVNPAAPAATRGKTTQADFSALQVLGPGWFWDDLNLIGEFGYIHINSVTPVGGITALSNGSGSASRNAWAYSFLASFDWKNVFSGWDITVPLTFQGIAKGSPPPGTFGALWGEGDQRASAGLNFSYLQRLGLGLTYSAFLGRPDLGQHPYADRDYVGFNVKYQF
ncbi:MAG TPA: DUF1302 family protein [Nevskia sp.]|nr:DUF1302 family protein [Nevskia sp.]